MKFETDGLTLAGMTVIVVEDDVTLRALLSDILRELGAECLAFDNAEDALIRLLEIHGQCSLLLADHGVPGSLKGKELLALVHEKWPELPAIITSGFHLDISDIPPPVLFLFKPWSIDELLAAINEALAANRSPLIQPTSTVSQNAEQGES